MRLLLRNLSLLSMIFLTAEQAVQAEEFAPLALNSLTMAPPNIGQARVFQQDGSLLGNIHKVALVPKGKGQVYIGVAGGREISLSTVDASYDASTNVVVTDETATKKALALP